MNKLPLSIGILAWRSGQTLVDTLFTYYTNGLFNIVKDITILFQEVSEQDKKIADHFNLPYLGINQNIGIGKGFLELAQNSKTSNVLLLEHDWHLIEDPQITYNRLSSGIDLLQEFDVIKYRHKTNPGYPLFSRKVYEGNELGHYDNEIGLVSPHLLESTHWIENPSTQFPDKIQQQGEYFTTTSRWSNWTNNPCMFKKDFYIKTVTPYAGEGIGLEGNIAKWWSRQNFKVAHGGGLFTHVDQNKFGI